MKVRSRLVILLIVAALLAEASLSFAAPSESGEDLTPSDVDVSNDELSPGPPADEPMPCTNQRAKAWFGCS
jgi:hypothetical protein